MGIKGDLLVKRGYRKNFRQEPMEAMKVVVHNNDITKALRTLKKKMQREGMYREMKKRRAYEKPSEKKAREKAESVRRWRKLQRKNVRGY